MDTEKQDPGSKQKMSYDIKGETLARNTVLNLLGYGIPLVIGLISIPILIKYLGTERFGILTLIWVVFGYFSIFNLGLSLATTKFSAELIGKGKSKDIPDYLWTSVFSQFLLGIIGCLILVGVTSFLVTRVLNITPEFVNEAKTSFFLIALSLPFILISASLRGVLEAAQRFDLVNLVKIPSSSMNYIVPFICVLAGLGLPGIVLFIFLGRIITLIVWFFLCVKQFPQIKTKISFKKKLLKPLFSFGGWVTVSTILVPFFEYTDRFIIGAVVTMTAVSYYTAPYEMLMKLGILPSSLVITLFPTFSALYAGKNKERIKLIFGRAFKYLFIVIGGLTVLLFFYAPYILKIWLGEEFASQSTLVFQILCLGVLINSLARIPYSYIQGIGRADITAKLHIFEVVFFLPLAWFFIKWQGITGAAVAWTIRAAFDSLFLFYISWKKTKINLSYLINDRTVSAILILFVFFICGAIVNVYPWGVYTIAVLALLFALAVWTFAFSKEERIWFFFKLQNILKRG